MEYVSGLACVQAIAFTDAPPDGSELRTDSVAAINRCNEPVSTSVRLGSGGAFNGTTTVYHASDRGDWSSIHDLPPGYAHPWANGPLHPDIATARYEGPLVRLELLALSLTIVSVDKAMPPPPPSAPSLPPPPPAPPPQVPCVPCTNELPSGLAAQGRLVVDRVEQVSPRLDVGVAQVLSAGVLQRGRGLRRRQLLPHRCRLALPTFDALAALARRGRGHALRSHTRLHHDGERGQL